jgi:hypothetical protein
MEQRPMEVIGPIAREVGIEEPPPKPTDAQLMPLG